MRYRLIPTRGMESAGRFIHADDYHSARCEAERFSAELSKPVLIVSHPEGTNCVTALATVGSDPSEKKGRVR